MDTLTFIAKLIESLAWPVGAIILIVLLRREIGSLIPFIKKLKAGPVEAEFDRTVKELRTGAERELQIRPAELPTSSQRKLLQLAQVNRRSAIIEAWQQVELAAERVVSSRGMHFSPSLIGAQIRAFMKTNELSEEEKVLYYELRDLRNKTAHDPDFNPSEEAVINYIELASRLQLVLEKLQKNQAG